MRHHQLQLVPIAESYERPYWIALYSSTILFVADANTPAWLARFSAPIPTCRRITPERRRRLSNDRCKTNGTFQDPAESQGAIGLCLGRNRHCSGPANKGPSQSSGTRRGQAGLDRATGRLLCISQIVSVASRLKRGSPRNAGCRSARPARAPKIVVFWPLARQGCRAGPCRAGGSSRGRA